MLPKRVVILERTFPPNPCITGESACDLAAYLLEHQIAVTTVFVNDEYGGGGSQKQAVGEQIALKPVKIGKGKVGRFLGNFIEGFLMVWRGIRLKPDVVICMTNPPMLGIWGAFLLTLFRQKWMYWTMDLYPDAFLSAGLVGKGNPVYKLFHWLIRRGKPDYLITLGEEQHKYMQEQYGYQHIPHTVLPCGIVEKPENPQDAPEWYEAIKHKTIFCYAGNLGEAHSQEFLPSFVRLTNPDKHHIVAALYGAKAAETIPKIKDYPNVTLIKNLDRKHFDFVDVHLATLLPEWANVCVPSKAVSSVCLGGILIFNVPFNADGWQMFKTAMWRVGFEDMEGDISKILAEITPEIVRERKQKTAELVKQLYRTKERAYEDIRNFITKA